MPSYKLKEDSFAQTRQESRLRSLKAIEEISSTFSSLYTSDLAFNLNKILKPFCGLTGADYGIVFLVKNPNEQLWVEALYGLPAEYKEVRNKKQILHLHSHNVKDNWPSVRAILRKQIVLIKNIQTMNMGFSEYFLETIKPNRIVSVAAVPIIINGKAAGTITKYYAKPHAFDEEEISFMRTTANIITSNIEKNYLLESARKSEEELAQANEVLKQMNQELDSFVYISSHDLREPLRTIESFVSVVQDDFVESNLNSRQKDCLTRIVNATKRMRNLIEDLTSLARATRDIKHNEHEAVDLNMILAEAEFELTAFIQKKNAKIIVENEFPYALGNREKIKSVFKNLISNGIKFNNSENPLIKISVQQNRFIPPGKVCFCVEDNGIGISAKYHDKVFELFQRLHSQDEYEGTGAGLAIVKKILEKYGCEVWIESEPGEGSRFFFTLLSADNEGNLINEQSCST